MAASSTPRVTTGTRPGDILGDIRKLRRSPQARDKAELTGAYPLPRPALCGERAGVRGLSPRIQSSDRHHAMPLTRPTSRRFAGRPLPAKGWGEVKKELADGRFNLKPSR